jgi:hypothetical protein
MQRDMMMLYAHAMVLPPNTHSKAEGIFGAISINIAPACC